MVVKLSETATSEIHFLALCYVHFEIIDPLFITPRAIMNSSLAWEKDGDGSRGTFLRVNLVAKSTEIPASAGRENPIARKVEKPQFFAFEWCFPLRVMEHRVAFRARPREKGIVAVTRRKSIVIERDWSIGIFNLSHSHRRYHANLLEVNSQYEMILMLLPILNWMLYLFS